MHLNRAVIIGCVTSAGPNLRYDERSNPTCRFWLDIEESAKDGMTRHSYIPVEIVGKLSESTAESLEAGQEVCVEGRLAYRKAGGKDGKQRAGVVVVSWYVTIAITTLPQPVESPN